MNSRHFIYRRGRELYRVRVALGKSGLMSALGQKQTYAVKNGMSALPPESDRESEFPQTVMSALPPKADMCSARADVR